MAGTIKITSITVATLTSDSVTNCLNGHEARRQVIVRKFNIINLFMRNVQMNFESTKRSQTHAEQEGRIFLLR